MAQEYGFEPDTVGRIVLAVDEACANVIRHAYGENDEGEIILRILDDADTLVFRLIDYSSPVDPRNIKGRDLDDIRPGGLGVHLIKEIMDQVRFMDPPPGAGNQLEMRKARIL